MAESQPVCQLGKQRPFSICVLANEGGRYICNISLIGQYLAQTRIENVHPLYQELTDDPQSASTCVHLKWMSVTPTYVAWRQKHFFNSSPSSAAYMCQWTGPSLVQVMACRLFDAKPLPEPMLVYCQLDPGNKFRWNLNRNFILFIQENAFQNVVCQNGGHFVQGEM